MEPCQPNEKHHYQSMSLGNDWLPITGPSSFLVVTVPVSRIP